MLRDTLCNDVLWTKRGRGQSLPALQSQSERCGVDAVAPLLPVSRLLAGLGGSAAWADVLYCAADEVDQLPSGVCRG
jgi:hypothetical protein